MIPKFRFFGKVNDGTTHMVLAESIDFKNGFIYYNYHDYTVEGGDHVYGDVIGFEDCVLMQSTGLFDANGKEIFEGDIVRMHSGELLPVKLHHGMFEPVCYYISNVFERVGNVFENPELLEHPDFREVLND
ncbi:YopX family protein [Streptococcus suis]